MIAYLSYFILIVEIVHHSYSSSDAKYSCNLFLQSCEIFKQPKVNCRIKHADLVFIASKIGWKDNLQELKDTLREGMFMVARIQDLFLSLSRLVSLNNTFRQTIGTLLILTYFTQI